MLILFIFAFLPIALSETYIGVFQTHKLKGANVSFYGLPIFRLHYQNTYGKTTNWREQADGISVITTCNPETVLHLLLWDKMVRLFDNIPSTSLEYKTELSNCPVPLYLDFLSFDPQCRLENSEPDEDAEDELDDLKYKDVLRGELTEEDKEGKIKFGFQKSCLHHHSFHPWVSYSDLIVDSPLQELFDDQENLDSFTQLLIVPKLFEIRYDFYTRILNILYEEFPQDINILDLYWFNIYYDQYKLKATAFFKFETSNPDVLSRFKFYSKNLDLLESLPNVGTINQVVTGSGSHKTLKLNVSHTLKDRTLKLVHYLDNTVFVDPHSVYGKGDKFFTVENCVRNTEKEYDNIKPSIVNVENTSTHSSSQRVVVTVCPPNNEVEYSLPLHLRYIPICKFKNKCTGYDYSLLTPPSVYYSTDLREDIFLFDDYELAVLTQYFFDASFYKYISELHVPGLLKFFNKTHGDKKKDRPYWSKANLVKEDVSDAKLLSIAERRMPSSTVAQFREDTGHLYNSLSVTCGLRSDFKLTEFITKTTAALLTLYTAFLILFEEKNFFDKTANRIIRYINWKFYKIN